MISNYIEDFDFSFNELLNPILTKIKKGEDLTYDEIFLVSLIMIFIDRIKKCKTKI